MQLPVTKLVGGRDGLATPARVARNRHLLPPDTRWIEIEGGNHSQFGDYGFQPGNGVARVSRQVQQQRLNKEALRLLATADTLHACIPSADAH